MKPITVGQQVFYGGKPAIVTRIDLPGEYGPNIELNGRTITTPGLDHYFSTEPGEHWRSTPTLSDCLFLREAFK